MGEIAEIRRGLTYKPDDVKTSGIRVLRSSNINEEYFETYKDDIFVDEIAINIPYVKNGDIIITSANGSSRLVGKHAIIKNIPDNAMVHGGFMLVASTNEPEFLNSSMSSPWYVKFINIYVAGGNGAIGNLSKRDLDNQEILVPYAIEQQKIGIYFQHLDNLITLHQRKYDKLVNVKKSMLEKMFPCDGKIVPDIRFSGFTEDWEQRKLNKISDKVTEKNIGLQYIETFTNSAEFGIISQRDFFDHEIANMSSLGGYYIVRSEDFVYNPRISATAPVGPINRNKLGRVGVMSPLYTVFRTYDVDTTYLEYFFKSRYWHSFMNFNGDSGARSDRFSIKDAIFFEMNIPIPHIEEQMKIGEYLTHIDNLITLHQRKLEKLKNIKIMP